MTWATVRREWALGEVQSWGPLSLSTYNLIPVQIYLYCDAHAVGLMSQQRDSRFPCSLFRGRYLVMATQYSQGSSEGSQSTELESQS
jgi:hypothetical protein